MRWHPVLTGFNPDPSILIVGETFYIPTSTFEWFPGVRIHRLTDLANRELLGRPVGSDHVDMRANPPAGGIWALCLSRDGELYHLIYTDVKFWSNESPFKDQRNYLTISPSIHGPWSPPVYLNGSGVVGSLLRDEDGRKWFLNIEWDHRGFCGHGLSGPPEPQRRGSVPQLPLPAEINPSRNITVPVSSNRYRRTSTTVAPKGSHRIPFRFQEGYTTVP